MYMQEVWMNSNSNGIEIARFRKLDCCSDQSTIRRPEVRIKYTKT